MKVTIRILSYNQEHWSNEAEQKYKADVELLQETHQYKQLIYHNITALDINILLGDCPE